MSRTVIDLQVQAASAARRAADRAGVEVRPLDGLAEFDRASRLVSTVWNDGGEPKAPSELLRALAHAGNFVAGAFVDGDLGGVSIAFFGLDGFEFYLHSHITGIHPDLQSKAVGFALKQFQRAWSLQHGLGVVRWTTDPLVRRNAFFNLSKLGATLVAYHDDFYGRMNDGLNAGEESDRVVVHWDLTSERSRLASEGGLEEPQRSDGVVLLSPDGDVPGRPEADGKRLLVWVPSDVVALRHEDPARARAWRLALRETLGRALSDGYRGDAMTRDGWYILSR